jgi:transposase InsO family protein
MSPRLRRFPPWGDATSRPLLPPALNLSPAVALLPAVQNRRAYLVAFMDDQSRFIVSDGLPASQSTALTLEVLRAGLASYGAPEEILTDNGARYVTWRGKRAFTGELENFGADGNFVPHPRTRRAGRSRRIALFFSTYYLPPTDT